MVFFLFLSFIVHISSCLLSWVSISRSTKMHWHWYVPLPSLSLSLSAILFPVGFLTLMLCHWHRRSQVSPPPTPTICQSPLSLHRSLSHVNFYRFSFNSNWFGNRIIGFEDSEFQVRSKMIFWKRTRIESGWEWVFLVQVRLAD